MRAVVARLQMVFGRLVQAGPSDPGVPEAMAQDVDAHVPGIFQTVDVADLVAVIGRDGYLADPLAGAQQLEGDLRVEVEAVRVALERDGGQRPHGVRTV